MTNYSADNKPTAASSLTRPFIPGGKYVPPHLRNQAGGGPTTSSSGPTSGPQPPGSANRAGYGDRRGSSRSYGGGGDRRGGSNYGGGGGGKFDGGGAPPPPPHTNSRWSNVDDVGGSDRRSSGYNGDRGGGGSYGRRDGPRRNERGFHGDTRPDKRLEKQLFEKEIQQTTGINFDRYDNIPVETSGHDIPDPIEEFTEEVIGPDLYRNVQLCGYTKPTPVQKYSIPIASANRDLMACAQTGSGKTAGFLFPIIIAMLRNGGSEPPGGIRGRRVSLVLFFGQSMYSLTFPFYWMNRQPLVTKIHYYSIISFYRLTLNASSWHPPANSLPKSKTKPKNFCTAPASPPSSSTAAPRSATNFAKSNEDVTFSSLPLVVSLI